jgi:hypothetical protein
MAQSSFAVVAGNGLHVAIMMKGTSRSARAGIEPRYLLIDLEMGDNSEQD